MKTLDELEWKDGNAAFRCAWATREVSVVHWYRLGCYTITRYTDKETGGCLDIGEIWNHVDTLTAQAVLIHLTQGGNDENA